MQERAEEIHSLAQEKSSIKEKFAKILVAGLLFLACPGDDIAVVAVTANPLATQTQGNLVEPILGLYWLNNKSKRMGIKEPKVPPVQECKDFKEECLSTSITAENAQKQITI